MRYSSRGTFVSAILLTSSSLALAAPAFAQSAVADAPEPSETTEAETPVKPGTQPSSASDSEIIVTGSLIARAGFTAPTPVTVVGQERAERLAITNSADLLAQVPSFRASVSRSRPINGQVPGAANANLRGIGTSRTLVLIDGRRVVPSSSSGAVDLNLIPSALVSRSEVVTGGASAAYGADAVAGVVNFIMDTKFTGLKGDITGGITQRGDDGRLHASLAGGASFAGDRGHIIAGVEYENSRGTGDCYTREFCKADVATVANVFYGSNGLPGTLFGTDVRNARASTGGLIVSNPAGTSGGAANSLRGIAFGPNGGLTNYEFGLMANGPTGAPSSAAFMVGGGEPNHLFFVSGLPMVIPVKRYSGFVHAEYELGAATLFGEAMYGRVEASDATKFTNQGNLTIRADNAFLPEEVRAAMVAGGIPSFSLGRLNEDMLGRLESTTDTYRAMVGAKVDLGGDWKFDGYYQYGFSKLRLDYLDNRLNANFANAIDAIADPANPGQVICRSAAARADGCQPLNLFGVGQFSPAAFDYVSGDGRQVSKFTQHVVSGTISGSPFKTWAGPVSIAAGGNYRSDDTSIASDALSVANAFVQFNTKGSDGKVEVVEGFLEANVPLATDLSFAKLLEVNGAIRRTHTKASQPGASGGTFNATTWKIGAVYEPIDALRIRVTRSRDIRAPNATELFSPPLETRTIVTDRFTGGQINVPVFATGNIAAEPEKADTFTAGFVLRPVRGLNFAVDYYNINLKNALGQLAAQTIVDQCFQGNAARCEDITRVDGSISSVRSAYVNFGSVKARGVDLDLSYSLPLKGESGLNFRILATRVLDLIVTDASGSVNNAGINGTITGQIASPKWTVDGVVSFNTGGFTFTVQERFISKGRARCCVALPGDPDFSLTDNVLTMDRNGVPARFYTNLIAEYEIGQGDGGMTLFGSITNLFDRTPPQTSTTRASTNPEYYDVLLRRFQVGARFRF